MKFKHKDEKMLSCEKCKTLIAFTVIMLDEGLVSRGKACEILGIDDRNDLDDYIKKCKETTNEKPSR